MTLIKLEHLDLPMNLPPGGELKVFIDGVLVDNLMISEEPQEGDVFGSELITAALGDREVKSVNYVGTMVMVTTVED